MSERDFLEERRWQRITEEVDRTVGRLFTPRMRAIYMQNPLLRMLLDRTPGYATRLARYRKRFLEENKHNIRKDADDQTRDL